MNKLANTLAAASGDAKIIHLYSTGQHFDRLHQIAGESYDTLSEDYDTIAEIAREYDLPLANPNNAATTVGWVSLSARLFNYSEGITELMAIYEKVLIEAKICVSAYPDDAGIQNALGDLIQRYQKELRFKLRNRL